LALHVTHANNHVRIALLQATQMIRPNVLKLPANALPWTSSMHSINLTLPLRKTTKEQASALSSCSAKLPCNLTAKTMHMPLFLLDQHLNREGLKDISVHAM